MVGTDFHCHVVSESLAGDRAADEQAYASLAVLTERLEALKQSSSLFADVQFSPYAERLARHATVAVG